MSGCTHGLGSMTRPWVSGGRWICRLIFDPREWQIEEEEAISRMKTEELDRLVAAGTIREIDREHVRFIVRRIVQPTPGVGNDRAGITVALPMATNTLGVVSVRRLLRTDPIMPRQ